MPIEEEIIILETTLDHLTGEELGMALDQINMEPAVLDAILLPGIGKKNRPVHFLQVLCLPQYEQKVCELVFQHTHALGIRSRSSKRYVLERHPEKYFINGEEIQGKAHIIKDQTYIRPEADEILKLAKKTGIGAPGLRWLPQKGESGD